MQSISALVRKLNSLAWLPTFLAVAGFAAYILEAVHTARTKTSFLDEGLYLFKGYLFAQGLQTPFADFGVWTNHAVLSFLIPGYIQKWFGPGLQTGRYFMIALSLVTLLGLWIFAKRWGNSWWAAAIVWAMALNPAEIKLHTLAISEGTVSALLVWIVVLITGDKRPLWQVLLGSALTAPLVLTRENMAFVPLIVFVYIFWQHGWKTGSLAMLSAAVPFLVGNAFYFPDNLKFWIVRAPGLPATLADSLSPWISQGPSGDTLPEPENANLYRMFLYFWLTFRLHFLSLVSAVVVWLLLPYKFTRTFSERARAVTFLSVLLLVLYIAHIQAAFFGEFCISCILLYVGYFDFLGLMMLAIAWPLLVKELSVLRQSVIFVVVSLMILGIGFSSYEDLSTEFTKRMIERLDGTYIWGAMIHYITVPQLILFRVTFVLLIGALLIFLGAVGLKLLPRWFNGGPLAGGKTGLFVLNSFLILGFILSPTRVLGKGNDFFDCGDTDVLQSYKEAGAELSRVIQPGTKIYWEGRLAAIFLYLPDVQIYPPQLNHVHSYHIGGNSQELLRFGQWNDKLAQQWLADADYIMLQGTELVYLTKEMLESDNYVKVMSAPKAEKCRWQSVISIYKRADTAQ